MKRVLNLYKPNGMTPLEVIGKLRDKYPEYKESILGYAGRLDPMAVGVLLILIGEENKKRKVYERLSKKYTFEVVFGIATDTYDVLGKITKTKNAPSVDELQTKLPSILQKYTGTINQPYPPYSSPRVNGKPLFFWARQGRLDEIKIPEKRIMINSITLQSIRKITASELQKIVKQKIENVTGNFRQNEICSHWEGFFAQNTFTHFPVAEFTVDCSSGTYVRSLAKQFGEEISCGGLALSITRTKVGPYTVKNSIRIFK